MARASSYTKLTELTAEQQAKFKETATILAQGKTTTDGATTDINIPFDEFGGGGGGGGYTVVYMTTLPSIVSGDLTITPDNKTLVIIESLPNESFQFVITAPNISQNEYIDIMIQIKNTAAWQHAISAPGFIRVTQDDYGGHSTIPEGNGSYAMIHLIGKCMTIATYDATE
jgi:hypothetical protein